MTNLVGTWKLESCEFAAEDGRISYPYGRDASGYLVYTDTGHMIAAITAAGRAPFTTPDVLRATPDEKAAALESCLAYSGRYEQRDDRVVHHVEVALFPNWVGGSQERIVALDGDRLTLTSAPMLLNGVVQVGRVIWTRCPAAAPAT